MYVKGLSVLPAGASCTCCEMSDVLPVLVVKIGSAASDRHSIIIGDSNIHHI